MAPSRRNNHTSQRRDPHRVPPTRRKFLGTLTAAAAGVVVGVGGGALTPLGSDGVTWIRNKLNPPEKLVAAVTYPPTSISFLGDCTYFWVPPKSNGDDQDEDFGSAEWIARNRAAIPVREAGFTLTISSDNPRPVTVLGIHFDIVNRQSAPPSSFKRVSSSCRAGTGVYRYARVDLDAFPPKIIEGATPVKNTSRSRTEPLAFPYVVDSEETESLLIDPLTKGYVEWRVVLTWSDGEETGNLVIDNFGQPFRSIAD